MTYPLITEIDQSIYGIVHDNIGGVFQIFSNHEVIWGQATRTAFDYIHFPDGIDLTNSIPMYTTNFFLLVLGFFFSNALLGFNCYILLAFAGAGFNMFILTRYLTKSDLIAWICGLFYAFNPYFQPMTQAYGPSFISVFMPLVVYLGIRLIENPTKKNILGFICGFVVFFGENFYYSYFLLVTFLIVSPILIMLHKEKLTELSAALFAKGRFSRLKISCFVFSAGAAASILYVKLAPFIQSRRFSLKEAVYRSLNPYYYGVPSIGNGLFEKAVLPKLKHSKELGLLEIYERANYLGYTAIALIIASFFFYKRLSKIQQRWYLTMTLLIFSSMILAVGPLISLNGRFHDLDTIMQGDYIYGPSYIFFQIAPMFRFIARYHCITIFAFITLVSLSLLAVQQIQSTSIRRFLVATFAIGMFIEYSNLPNVRTTNIFDTLPKAYLDLAKDDSEFAIVQLPVPDFPTFTHYNAFATIHKKKIYGKPQHRFEENILDLNVQKKLIDVGVKYVVITEHFPPVTYPPMQIPWPRPIPPEIPKIAEIGYMSLVKDYGDSRLFKLSKKTL